MPDLSTLAGVLITKLFGKSYVPLASLPVAVIGQDPNGNPQALLVAADGTLAVTTETVADVTEVRSTALEASHVLKATPGKLKQFSAFSSAAGYLLLMNSATVPADGAVPLLYPPIPIAAGQIVVLDLPTPLVASTGIAACISSTGSFTKTVGGATCAFYAQVI